jgi:pimeloyl-ACP methyl ester carboxylesterase
MYLNAFASDLEALDLSASEELRSLLESAADLGIAHAPELRYGSRNTVLRHQRFHFLEWGEPDAPPIVLLHGGNQTAHSWDLVSLHLADRYRVLALDQRGHGDSEWARDADYSAQAMAEDALTFIDQQRLDRPLVIGHSMGGMVTMTLLAKRPEVARAAIFVDVGPEISGDGADVIRAFVERNVEFDDLDEFVERVTAYDPYRSREHITRTVRYNLLRRADGKYVSKSDRVLHDRAFRRNGGDGEAGGRIAGTPDLAAVRALALPALVVRGGDSNVLTAEGAERFAAALPQGRLVTVADCGHNVHGQNTPGFLEAVRPFVDSV